MQMLRFVYKSFLFATHAIFPSDNFSASCMVLHNIFIQLREGPPSLPPNIQEEAFQERFQHCQITIHPVGRPN